VGLFGIASQQLSKTSLPQPMPPGATVVTATPERRMDFAGDLFQPNLDTAW
jgi:hypothetical protein